MRCPKCNSENPEGVKFCGECGTSLRGLCPQCGFENPPGFNFCGNCGSILTNRPTPRPAEGERRQLTVMFADLVGFTTLSEQLDPEELRDILAKYHATCAEVFRKYAGHIAQYLGDGLLVYFGYPAAHEDDARRAVQAGLDILEALKLLNEGRAISGHRLAVRIGIHTGLVVMGELGGGDWHEQLALGETPNVAARLQDLTEADSIVVSATTYRLCRQHFHCKALGPHSLKGLSQPMDMYRVTGIAAPQPEATGESTGGLTPLVGREEELATLLALWQQAEAGKAQVAFISGEAGIGKSRLTQTFGRRAGRLKHIRLELRCSSYYQNSALYPVIETLQRALNWNQTDSADQRLNRLAQAIANLDSEAAPLLPLAADLFSLPHDSLTLTPEQQKERTLEGLVRVLLAAAKQQPVLLIVEDLHWADSSTVELLNLAISKTTEARILFLLTTRPEFSLTGRLRSNLTRLSLHHLPATQTQQLVERVAGGKALPPEVLHQIVTKTDGVPLFVEELTRMVMESGLLHEEADRYVLTGPLPPLAIPSTLRDSLMARLDKLATVKEIAQIGSVIGREFSYELIKAVAEMNDSTLQRELRRLVEAGLLYQGGVPPLATYIFKHALIQETAYRSLLRSKRQQFHLKIVLCIELKFPETAEAHPEVAAHHYTEAGLNEQAVIYWQKAGQRASQRSAHTEAAHHLNLGLDLLKTLPESSRRNQFELELQTALGRVLIASKGLGSPEASRAYERARVLCQLVGETPQLFPVLRGLNLFYVMRAEIQSAYEMGEQLLKLGTTLGDTAVLVPAYHALGAATFYLGQFDRARVYLQQGVSLYDPQKHRSLAQRYGFDPGVTTLCWLSWTMWYLGYPDQAVKNGRRGLSLAREINHPLSIAYALQYLARVYQLRREPQPTRELAETSIQLATEHGFPDWLAQGKVLLGWAKLETGQLSDGMNLIEEGLTAYEANGAQVGRPYFMGLLAEAFLRNGQLDYGLQVLNDALTAIAAHGHRHYEAELHRLRGEFMLARGLKGDLAEAEACFERALKVAHDQNARSLELRALASRIRARGNNGIISNDGLAAAYHWFSEGFEAPDLITAKALLTEHSS